MACCTPARIDSLSALRRPQQLVVQAVNGRGIACFADVTQAEVSECEVERQSALPHRGGVALFQQMLRLL